MGTVVLTHVIANRDSQEYSVYSRAMRPRLAAPDAQGAQGQANFATEISRVGTACLLDIIVEMYSRECSVCLRTIRLELAALIHRVLKG